MVHTGRALGHNDANVRSNIVNVSLYVAHLCVIHQCTKTFRHAVRGNLCKTSASKLQDCRLRITPSAYLHDMNRLAAGRLGSRHHILLLGPQNHRRKNY